MPPKMSRSLLGDMRPALGALLGSCPGLMAIRVRGDALQYSCLLENNSHFHHAWSCRGHGKARASAGTAASSRSARSIALATVATGSLCLHSSNG